MQLLRILYKILGQRREVLCCVATDELGRKVLIKKQDFQKYDFVNARITSDNRIITQDKEITTKLYKDTRRERIVYHGSHRGITEAINTQHSHNFCAFGKGFYTEDNEYRARDLIVSDEAGHLYTLSIDLQGLKVYNLFDLETWVLFIGVNIGWLKMSKYPKLQRLIADINSCDVVVGRSTAERGMFLCSLFIEGRITDKAFFEELETQKVSMQYVFKNDEACKNITILSDDQLSATARNELRQNKGVFSEKLIDLDSRLCTKYRREGLYVYEILEKYR